MEKYIYLIGAVVAGVILIMQFLGVGGSGWYLENMIVGPRNWRCRLVNARCRRIRAQRPTARNTSPFGGSF